MKICLFGSARDRDVLSKSKNQWYSKSLLGLSLKRQTSIWKIFRFRTEQIRNKARSKMNFRSRDCFRYWGFRLRDRWLSKSAKLDIRGAFPFLCWSISTNSVFVQIFDSTCLQRPVWGEVTYLNPFHRNHGLRYVTSPQTRDWRHVESKIWINTELVEMLQQRNGKGPRISSFADFDNQRSRDQKPNFTEGFNINLLWSKTKCLELQQVVSTKQECRDRKMSSFRWLRNSLPCVSGHVTVGFRNQ